MAKSFEPPVEAYVTEIRIEPLVNRNAYVFEVGIFQVDWFLYKIIPGCNYPSECLTENCRPSAPKKPMVALNS